MKNQRWEICFLLLPMGFALVVGLLVSLISSLKRPEPETSVQNQQLHTMNAKDTDLPRDGAGKKDGNASRDDGLRSSE